MAKAIATLQTTFFHLLKLYPNASRRIKFHELCEVERQKSWFIQSEGYEDEEESGR
jgi:hypothetical protein